MLNIHVYLAALDKYNKVLQIRVSLNHIIQINIYRVRYPIKINQAEVNDFRKLK